MRGVRRRRFAPLAALLLLLARVAWADPGEPASDPRSEPRGEPPGEQPAETPDESIPDPLGEPPAEAPEGVDYETEIADSVEAGMAETGFGATGRADGRPHARRRLRFSDGGFAGEAREGADDPLAGGVVESRTARGRCLNGRGWTHLGLNPPAGAQTGLFDTGDSVK